MAPEASGSLATAVYRQLPLAGGFCPRTASYGSEQHQATLPGACLHLRWPIWPQKISLGIGLGGSIWSEIAYGPLGPVVPYKSRRTHNSAPVWAVPWSWLRDSAASARWRFTAFLSRLDRLVTVHDAFSAGLLMTFFLTRGVVSSNRTPVSGTWTSVSLDDASTITGVIGVPCGGGLRTAFLTNRPSAILATPSTDITTIGTELLFGGGVR